MGRKEETLMLKASEKVREASGRKRVMEKNYRLGKWEREGIR